jgi:hypothetical protein
LVFDEALRLGAAAPCRTHLLRESDPATLSVRSARSSDCGPFLACLHAMQRILVVLRAPIDVETVRRRCSLGVAQAHEMAVCYVLQPHETSVEAAVQAQRRITDSLRQVLDRWAETIPVFVVTECDGDGIQDCASEWGATVVDA